MRIVLVRTIAVASVWLAGAVMAGPAAAHHVMDNQLPATLGQGLLSGLGHPVIGLDHLAAVVAVGCLAALHRRGGALVVGFVLAMLAGAALHLRGMDVPAAELLVALTVVVLGVLVVVARADTATLLAAFGVAGLVHGYALGESIVGAEPTPLLAYFAGLALIQSGLGLAVMMAVRALQPGRRPLRITGAAVVLAGAAFVAMTLAA
jgi:urease accessory protein